MTRSSIPVKIRLCAMWCHFFNLLWIPIVVAVFATASKNPIVNRDISTVFITLLIVPPLSLIIARIVSLLFWLINRQRHPFIAESGREVMNFSLSVDLYVLTIGAISLLCCGSSIQLLSGIGIVAFLIPVLLLLHFCLVLVGGSQALQGLTYIYPSTVQFFK